MELRKGYKLTEVGVIPEDWEVKQFIKIVDKYIDYRGRTPKKLGMDWGGGNILALSANNVQMGRIDTSKEAYFGSLLLYKKWMVQGECEKYDVLLTMEAPLGNVTQIPNDNKYILSQRVILIKPKKNITRNFLANMLTGLYFQNELLKNATGSTAQGIQRQKLDKILIYCPPTVAEQEAIASALSDADTLIQSLEKLIAKKRLIKQGAMQELLKPKDGWVLKTLEEVIYCLDNLRVPLNDSQRKSMKGDIPYCGANGILDYINDYCIDDSIILIAEDGGYFDEYYYRPIAYKMTGKCWVNNHAHILKAKENTSQDFIYYSLVHKNILRYIASGTRAKLNKSEMYKIEIDSPASKAEQTRIANILTDMDSEITTLEVKLNKYKQIKQGMMQELLTGKTRLV